MKGCRIINSKCPLVSIIVPVYNAERTIERCLVSIRNQTYKNLEILIINDGSQDHTMRVIEKYRMLDERFTVIDKVRTGVSSCRNLGIVKAQGTYIQFVDSDDWIAPDMIERYVGIMELYGCDMLISDYYRVVKRKIYKNGDIKTEGILTQEQFATQMMDAPANFYYGVMWNKFYRADIIRTQFILCPEEMNWCEDFYFNLEYLKYTENVYVHKQAYYYYVKTKGSLVNSHITIRKTVDTKKDLYIRYKGLYESIDLYTKNKFRIQLFMVAFAHDRRKKVKSA